MMRIVRGALKFVLVAACGATCHVAAAQEGGSAQAASAASVPAAQAPGTLELLLGRQGRQQARAAAAADNSAVAVPAALRADQQPIAASTAEAAPPGKPNNVARDTPVVTPIGSATSDGSGAPSRANAVARDVPATSLGQTGSSAGDATGTPPVPQT